MALSLDGEHRVWWPMTTREKIEYVEWRSFEVANRRRFVNDNVDWSKVPDIFPLYRAREVPVSREYL